MTKLMRPIESSLAVGFLLLSCAPTGGSPGRRALSLEGEMCLDDGASATLAWPRELPAPLPAGAALYETPKANYVLDLHGDPSEAQLVLFMAGNQYMALPDLVAAFKEWYPAYAAANGLRRRHIDEVFYATTPPGKLIAAMDSGHLVLGNLTLRLKEVRGDGEIKLTELWPDVFMTGPRQQRTLRQKGYAAGYYLYAHNRGVGILVRDGNPLGITGVLDFARDDVRVAISSPTREPASYDSYAGVINRQSAGIWAGPQPLATYVLGKPTTLSPAFVHHRENPQFLADGLADAAPMYYHFGLYLEEAFPDVFDFVVLSDTNNEFATLGMAEILSARHPESARAWIEFLRTDIARGIYESRGFRYATATELDTFIVPPP